MKLSYAVLVTQNLSRARAFYEQVLGQTVICIYDPDQHILEIGESMRFDTLHK